MALKGKQRKARARWRERVRLEDGLKLDLNGLIVQRLGALGPLAVGAGICLQDRDHYGATIIASK